MRPGIVITPNPEGVREISNIARGALGHELDHLESIHACCFYKCIGCGSKCLIPGLILITHCSGDSNREEVSSCEAFERVSSIPNFDMKFASNGFCVPPAFGRLNQQKQALQVIQRGDVSADEERDAGVGRRMNCHDQANERMLSTA